MQEAVNSAPERPRGQWTLIKLFVWMTLVSIALGWMFANPWGVFIALYGICIATPALLTIIAIYGGRWLRTFCIGGLFPAGSILLSYSSNHLWALMLQGGSSFDDMEFAVTMASSVAAYFGLIAFVGLLAICVRWLVE